MRNRQEDTRIALSVGQSTRITSDPGLELDPVLSPDGLTLAYSAGPPGQTTIRLRQLADGRTTVLTEGERPANQRWPQWSADGTLIVFQAGRAQLPLEAWDNASSLYVVPARGGVARPLVESTAPRRAFSPAWFPNRPEIVFAASDGIYALAAAGSEAPRRLMPGSRIHSPRWSPDRRWLAYVEDAVSFTFGEENFGDVSGSRLIVHPAGSAAAFALTDGNSLVTNPVWLADNRTLLFIQANHGRRDVFQLRVNPSGITGDDPDRLTSGTNAHTISLSADGKLLAYSSYTPGANIWSIPIPAAGVSSVADATQLTFGNEMIGKLAISPDGRWLAFDSDREGQADVWKMPIGGGPAERVTRGPEDEFVNGWSPDGRELVIHATHNGQRDVLVVSADGARREPVATTPLQEHHAAWGADGNSIIFDAPPKAGERDQAFVATRAKAGAPWGPPRQITRNGSGDPAWSPNGRLIATCADDELRVVAPDGSGERVLVSGKKDPALGEPSYPVWSRDGLTVYYRVYDRARQSSIWSVGLDGGTPRLLVRFDDPSRRSLRREFATDGQRFYFSVARDESDIWLIELKGNR
jgi:TolB protein